MPNSPMEVLMNTITGKPARPKPARKARKSKESASETKVKEVKKYSQSIAKNVVSNVLKNLKAIKTSKAKIARPKPVRKSRRSTNSVASIVPSLSGATKVKEYAETIANSAVSNVMKQLGSIKATRRKAANAQEAKQKEFKKYSQNFASNVVSNVMKNLKAIKTSKAKLLRPKPVRNSRKKKSLSNVTNVREYAAKMANSVVTNVMKKLGSINSKKSRPKPVRKPRKSRALTMNSVSLSLNKPVEEEIKERLSLLKEESEKLGNGYVKSKGSLKARKRESAKNKESRRKIGELLGNKEKWAPLKLGLDKNGHIINKAVPGVSLNFIDSHKKQANAFANAALKQLSKPKAKKSRAVSLDNVKPKRSRSSSKSKSKSEKSVSTESTKLEKNIENYRLAQKKKFEQKRKSK